MGKRKLNPRARAKPVLERAATGFSFMFYDGVSASKGLSSAFVLSEFSISIFH